MNIYLLCDCLNLVHFVKNKHFLILETFLTQRSHATLFSPCPEFNLAFQRFCFLVSMCYACGQLIRFNFLSDIECLISYCTYLNSLSKIQDQTKTCFIILTVMFTKKSSYSYLTLIFLKLSFQLTSPFSTSLPKQLIDHRKSSSCPITEIIEKKHFLSQIRCQMVSAGSCCQFSLTLIN